MELLISAQNNATEIIITTSFLRANLKRFQFKFHIYTYIFRDELLRCMLCNETYTVEGVRKTQFTIFSVFNNSAIKQMAKVKRV